MNIFFFKLILILIFCIFFHFLSPHEAFAGASDTSSLRPHTLVYSLRPHTLIAFADASSLEYCRCPAARFPRSAFGEQARSEAFSTEVQARSEVFCEQARSEVFSTEVQAL